MVDPTTSRLPRRLLLPVIYLGFVSLGLPDGTLGVAWPRAYLDLAAPIGLAGGLMMLGTLLTAVSGFSSGWIVGRFGIGRVVLVSGLLTGGALIWVGRSDGMAGLFLAMIPLGLGAGAVDAGLNGFVARHYSGRHMNWLHACWGVGATCGPLLMGQALAGSLGWRGGYLVIGGIQLGLAALFLLSLGWWSTVPTRPGETVETAPRPRRALGANSPEGIVSAGIFALYVGAEMTIGLWAGTVLVAGRGLGAETAALWVAGYYGAITLGRFGAGFIVEKFGNRATVRRGCELALAGVAAFALGGGSWVSAAGLVAIGLGFAPVYPGLMHEVPRRFAPEAVQTVIGRQSGAASLGAASLPAVAGLVAEAALGAVAWVAFGVALALAAAVIWLDRRT